jgi:FMN reductase
MILTVVSAGLRDPSSTRLLADRIAAAAERELVAVTEGGLEVRHVEVRRHAHAVADALLTGFPTGDLAAALRDVAEADALVLVTPTFQASYSGLFKSFMDLVEADDVRGTPVVLAATGGTERHSLVIEHALRPLATYLGLTTVPTGIYAATQDFGGEGTAALTQRIDRSVGELRALLGIPSVVRPAGTDPAAVTPFAELLARLGH